MNKSLFAFALMAAITMGAGCSTGVEQTITTPTDDNAASGTQLAEGEPGATDTDGDDGLIGGDAAPSNTGTDNAGEEVANVKEFTVYGDNFAFDLKEMEVKKGDTVRVTFVNKEGFHDWVIDEFNAATKQIRAEESETIEFVADKAGTFEYYCSVGQHRANGMVGTLTVTE